MATVREIKHHVVKGNEKDTVRVLCMDAPGSGGACHDYVVLPPEGQIGEFTNPIVFQNGPIKEKGVNGVTQEALLAIVIDRLEHFQKGPFPSEYNVNALFHVINALDCLKRRTRERIVRGIEGQAKA